MTVTSAGIDQHGRRSGPTGTATRRDRPPVLFEAPRAAPAPLASQPTAPAPRAEPNRQPLRQPSRPRRENPAQPRTSVLRSARPAPPVPQAARDLLIDASRGLGLAIRSAAPADRYAAAHLAALRAAAAVLAARARPVRGRRGSAWELMAKVAPEFAEWAAFFAAGSAKRQAAEAGLTRLVTGREADDMVRQVSAFLDLVEDSLVPDEARRPVAR